MTDKEPITTELLAGHGTRKDFLWNAAVGAAVLVAPSGASKHGLRRRALQASAPRRGGVLKMARELEPASFDPSIPGDNGSIFILQQIFDQLVRINPTSTSVSPGLAQSWHTSPDGKTYSFELRTARFSNGAPVTADDVVFSLKRAFSPKTGQFSFLYGPGLGNVKSVQKLNNRTVQIKLMDADAPFLDFLSSFAVAIVPEAAVKKDPKGFAQKPIGSGAFILKSFSKGQLTHLIRNPHYWQAGKPYLDEVMVHYVPDDNTRILSLQGGQVDVATAVPNSQVSRLNSGQTRVLSEPQFRWDGIWLNQTSKPLAEKAVRQALNYATDKKTLVSRVLFGYGEVANAMIPKMQYWRPDVTAYPYDIAKAKALIAQSSVPRGFAVSMMVASGDTIHQQVAEVVQASWAQIGVKVNIVQLDSGTAFSRLSKFDYDCFIQYATADQTAPDESADIQFDARVFGGTQGFTHYKNAQATQLCELAAHHADASRRAVLFAELQRVTMDDPWGVALWFAPALTGITSRVKGFHTYATGWWALENASLA